ncbi:hypothetical protein O181_011306 [Austropuccinia psidii MF-1]|uniref:Uncharacterized protein n=1 Tax=Austropuccinia psidii MF-1 TaxID=1389203 RepID=A0A9Q3BVI7_9BASI|nr:hypothetical protein [Austropuccinia psidii MF-1]
MMPPNLPTYKFQGWPDQPSTLLYHLFTQEWPDDPPRRHTSAPKPQITPPNNMTQSNQTGRRVERTFLPNTVQDSTKKKKETQQQNQNQYNPEHAPKLREIVRNERAST